MMVKELMARIILGLLSGLVVVGVLILLGIIPARAEMLDPWGHPRYQAPREAKPVRKPVPAAAAATAEAEESEEA